LHWFSGPDIKHITAQFEWITSYSDPRSKSKSGSTSSSINHARLTDLSPTSNPAPIPLPALADKTIIQVALGDHHHVALTSQGEVYTWGEGSNGQLGLGDGRHHVGEPRRVTFPGEEEGEKAFIFGITAGGWHTGALALGGREKSLKGKEVSRELEEAAEKRNEDGEKGGEEDGGSVEQRSGRMNFGTPYFRVGFAGRGAIGRGGTGIRGLRWNRGHGNDGGPSDV
jgi:SCF-associated factor 1